MDCPICTLPKKELIKLPCGHTICKGCKKHLLKKTCPFCRERFENPSRDNLQELLRPQTFRPPTPMPVTPQVQVVFDPVKFEDDFYRRYDYLKIKREKRNTEFKKKKEIELGTSAP
jgi:hypothetical protein